MSQVASFTVNDQTGASFLSDISAKLHALASTSKGGSVPASIEAGMFWIDDSVNPLIWYFYDGDTSIKVGEFDHTSNVLTIGIAQGGTGANTASAARTNLGIGTAGVATQGTGDGQVPFGSETRWSRMPQAVKTGASYTIVAADVGNAIIANRATAITFNLTAAATLGNGFVCQIKNINAGQLTINPNGAETVDGNSDMTLDRYESTVIFCDGSNWRSTGKMVEATVLDNLRLFMLQLQVEDPQVKAYTMDGYAGFAYTILSAGHDLTSGTATFDVEIGGTDVTGLDAISPTATPTSDTATAANSVAAADKVTVNVTAESSTGDLNVNLICRKVAP